MLVVEWKIFISNKLCILLGSIRDNVKCFVRRQWIMWVIVLMEFKCAFI